MLPSCTCCEEETARCPAFGWMSIHRWIGSTVIPNDFKMIPGPDGGKSVWERAGLERYEDAVWQWRVVVLGTGDIPDLTNLCLAQNRRDWSEWTAPISDNRHSEFFKLSLTEIKYFDSPLTAALIAGTFTLSLTVGSLSDSVTFNWNDSAATIQAALRALPCATNAGTINVTGGPLTSDHVSIAFIQPIDDVNVTLTSTLVGTPSNVLVETISDGQPGTNEQQLAHYEWPAHSGSFTLTVTASGSTQTTAPIAFNADAATIQNALLALSNLNTPPQITSSVLYPGTGSGNAQQKLEIANQATITGGFYQLILTLNGTTNITAPIAWNADSFGIDAALRALPNFLPTDDVVVFPLSPAPFPIVIEFQGTLGFQSIPLMGVANSLIGGDVRVSSSTLTPGTYLPATHAKHFVTFVGALQAVNVAPMTATSSLTNAPKILLTKPVASDVFAFKNWFEPLNVGTVWKHYLRKGWGNSINRAMRRTVKGITINPFEPPVAGSLNIATHPCGYGTWIPGGCVLPFFPNAQERAVRQTGSDFVTAKAEFNEINGTINVTAELPWEFSLEIRCLGCHYSSEFNEFGIHENSTNRGWQIYDVLEPEAFEPFTGGPCGTPDNWLRRRALREFPCRQWGYRPSNVPYLFRKRNQPDGYDAHLIRDSFFSGGTMAARKPPCSPGVVAMGTGYWLEQHYSRGFYEVACDDLQGAVYGFPLKYSCPPRPYHESEVERLTMHVPRLKLIFGTDFSWWGGWIDPESITLPKIRCTFDKFDLEDVRVLFLGGMPIGKCPQEDNRAGRDTADPGWTGSVLYPEAGDDFYGGGSHSWRTVVRKDFEQGTLEPLKRWLNLGGKTLVIDGGLFPEKLFVELGLASTVESQHLYAHEDPTPSPNTLNGSLFTSPVFGPALPDWYSQNTTVPPFDACWVEPNGNGIAPAHPFLNGVESGIDANGDPNIVTDFTIDGSNIAGQPMNTGHVTRGLMNVSQKFSWDGLLYNAFIMSGGTRSYTTCIPKVTPGAGAIVLGAVRGVLPIFGPEVIHPSIIGFTPIDYPAIVVEHWNAAFRLQFTHNGTTEETGPLAFTATVADIKNALEGLTNIGTSITVLGTALPNSMDVYFDSPLVQGQNVSTLVVLDTNAVDVSIVREGSSGVDEIQRLKIGRAPSRIVLSNVNELVDCDQWGTNWEGSPVSSEDIGRVSQDDEDNVWIWHVGLASMCDNPNAKIPVPDYSKRGYNFGLGLSHIASAKFLENLWRYRDDY